MKRIAVLDSSVVVSGIGWRGGEARAVLRLLALRGFVSARTAWLTAEWSETVDRVAREEKRWQKKLASLAGLAQSRVGLLRGNSHPRDRAPRSQG